jgi:hypothetical protein
MQSELERESIVKNSESATTIRTGILTIFGLALIWAFIMAAILGSLAAGIWTLIPTELLPWGATNPNLMGYVSHCSFAPTSSLILFAVSSVGVLLSLRITKGREIGLGVFIGTAGGLLIGLMGGMDITMFIGMGAGVGVGVVLGILIGLSRRSRV